jgi:excisionase family DNA binding protein
MSGALELPTPATMREAQSALRRLAPLAGKRKARPEVRVAAQHAPDREAVIVPRQAFELFLDILGQLANGNAVTIVPVQAELTTQQAADLLNVSRPFLVSLLEEGKLPFRKVGTHRRILASDLLKYRHVQDEKSRAALAELTQRAQDAGLGY